MLLIKTTVYFLEEIQISEYFKMKVDTLVLADIWIDVVPIVVVQHRRNNGVVDDKTVAGGAGVRVSCLPLVAAERHIPQVRHERAVTRPVPEPVVLRVSRSE